MLSQDDRGFLLAVAALDRGALDDRSAAAIARRIIHQEVEAIAGTALPAQAASTGLVDQLRFSPRVQNCLRSAGISTVGELAGKTASELRGIRSFGRTCLNEVRRGLAGAGLRLKGE